MNGQANQYWSDVIKRRVLRGQRPIEIRDRMEKYSQINTNYYISTIIKKYQQLDFPYMFNLKGLLSLSLHLGMILRTPKTKALKITQKIKALKVSFSNLDL